MKKDKMTDLEKQLASFYVDSSSDDDSSEDDITEDFMHRFYKDFNEESYKENLEMQKMMMIKENEA